MAKIRVAVLGYGHLGKWHCQKVEAHSNDVEFVAIVEKFPAGQEAAKINHPKVKVVADIKDVINDIDAAFVITPTSTHFELVKYLLDNNKHVFCEKPLCSNDEEARKLKEIASTKDLVIQVGHSERFHEAWEILRSKFQSLKSPYTVRINRVAPFKGRATDVDVVQDLGIHDLDLVLHLFKDKPVSVSGSGLKIRTKNWDHATLKVELQNGSEAIVVIGRNATKEIRELEVISSDGMITVDLFANKIYEATNTEFQDGSFVKETPYTKRDHLLLEHAHFYESIKNKKPAIITMNDGMNAVHLVDCSLKAMETQKPVAVKLGQ